jgi:hypothetical protein
MSIGERTVHDVIYCYVKCTLRNTLVFGVGSNKVRKDAIALGNTLTFKQIYDMAKVDESTKAQMKIITQGEVEPTYLHTG